MNSGKVWADWKYMQNVLQTFLVCAPKVQNKPAVFFALFFNNLFKETNLELTSNKLNIDSLRAFLYDDRTFNISQYYRASLFLLSNSEYINNDVISENDYNLFRDILVFNHPFEVRKGVFGIIRSEKDFSFKYSNNDLSIDEYKKLIPECLRLMIYNVTKITDRNLSINYASMLNGLLKHSTTMKVK